MPRPSVSGRAAPHPFRTRSAGRGALRRRVGVVAVVREGDDGYIRLLLLDPAHRGQGLGHDLLRAAEDDLDGAG